MSIHIGQTAILRRTFSQADFDRFAALSGDDNPIHVDPAFAARTRFRKTVAHGMLLYSSICRVLGKDIPGPGSLQLQQDLMFPTPTYVGERVTIAVEVSALPAKGLVELITTIKRPNDEIACQGTTLMKLPETAVDLPDFQPQVPRSVIAASQETTYRGLALGQTAKRRWVFHHSDLEAYMELTGDQNIIHSDAYTKDLSPSKPTLPGPLLGGLISHLLGTQLPGRGTNWLKQRFTFHAPAYTEQEITATVEIVRIRPEKNLVNLYTVCTNPKDQVICDGEALVLVKDLER